MLERHRAPWFAWFDPTVQAMLKLAGVGLLVILGMAVVTARHRESAAQQAVCAAKLDTYRAANPVLWKGVVHLGSPCQTLRSLTDEERP